MIATYQIVVLRADGGNVYRRNKGEKLENASPGDERRSFLRKAAVTALGGAVATLGLETSTAAKASTMPKQGSAHQEAAGRGRRCARCAMSCGCRTSRSGSASVLSAARSPSSSPIPPSRCGSTGPGRTTSSCSATPARPARRSDQAWPPRRRAGSPPSRCLWPATASGTARNGPPRWGSTSPRVFVDDQGKYAKQLGVSSSPAVVRVRV